MAPQLNVGPPSFFERIGHLFLVSTPYFNLEKGQSTKPGTQTSFAQLSYRCPLKTVQVAM